MGKLRCKIGKHSWEKGKREGVRVCKFCGAKTFDNVFDIGKAGNRWESAVDAGGASLGKPFRCKISLHSYENQVRGKKNLCKLCGEMHYVKTWTEEFSGGDGEAAG